MAEYYWRDRSLFRREGGESFVCVSREDVSRTAVITTGAGGDYDSRCSSCWVGNWHTMDYHAANVAAHVLARTQI